jgi:pyruvate/2-oxoglutarate/acetoin dehydrogenase E1 component
MYLRKGQVRRGAVAEIGAASVERIGSDVTIVATMLMVEWALQAAAMLVAEGIDTEVIDLRWIRPLDLWTLTSSLEKTGRLVVAERAVA